MKTHPSLCQPEQWGHQAHNASTRESTGNETNKIKQSIYVCDVIKKREYRILFIRDHIETDNILIPGDKHKRIQNIKATSGSCFNS